MKIFDEMLNEIVINNFLEHKNKKTKYSKNNDDLIRLKNYIKSDDYKNDVNRLINGDYFISIPKRIRIKKINSNRRRTCYFFEEKEMFLFKIMTYVLMQYDNLYEDSLYSFRKYQSHKDFFKKLKLTDRNRSLYVLKIDIKGYGESVNQDILLEKLKVILKSDKEFYDFLYWLLKRNKYIEHNKIINEKISIIPGTPMGSFFNNIYLTDLDTYIKNNSILYMRYSDDMAIFVDSIEKAEELKNYIINNFNKLKLEININKTKIYKPGENFSILGIDASKDGFDIAKESLNKIIFKLNHRLNRLLVLNRKKIIDSETAIKMYVDYINRYFYGNFHKEHEIKWIAWAFGIINKINTLKFLDKCVQNNIRTIISKKKSKVKYNIKYDDLKKYGYRNLVHFYYNNYKK